MSVNLSKERMFLVEYTNKDGEHLRSMLVLAPNKIIAWEKVAEYVALPITCTYCDAVSSGMYLID